jgi:CBS domain-containing protein
MGKIDRHFSRDLIAIEGSAPLRTAAGLLYERRIGAVAVRDKGKVVGLLTERDLVACALEPSSQSSEPVLKWVRRKLPTVGPNASEVDCANLMRDHNTRHLLVEEDGDIVGIISMRDVIRLMLDEKQFIIEQLQDYLYRS